MTSSSTDDETSVAVTMPQMGVSVAEGTVLEWHKQPGDWVERDEVIASIATDKIDTDVECPAAGRVHELVVEVGATVQVGAVLARIATDARPGEPHRAEGASRQPAPLETGEAAAALHAPGGAGELQGDAGAAHGSPEPAAPPAPPRRFSPVVARIAAEHGLDLARVRGTGRDGRVRKQDVLALVGGGQGNGSRREAGAEGGAPAAGAPAAGAPAGDDPGDLGAVHAAPLSRMRQAIGRRMVESLRTAATCTTVVEADLSRVEAARRPLGLTALPFVARATIGALREFPALNATLEDDVLSRHDAVHLGVAVSLGEDGLVVPVVHHAQELAEEGLARRIRELADRARAGELASGDVAGATFTLTNPGQYGALLATPVIDQPQVAVLDFEAVVKRPVVVTDADGNDAIAIRPMAYLCLSWDHRALDGALAAQFLSAVRHRLEGRAGD